jgi:hypothetical protein
MGAVAKRRVATLAPLRWMSKSVWTVVETRALWLPAWPPTTSAA